jgi:virginiamycin B lyase
MIGRITYREHVTVYSSPGISRPIGISPGPDGAIWFTNSTGDTVGRMTASGQMTFYTAPTISDPSVITPGPDGNMWFTNNTGPSVSRIITTTAGT